MIMSFILVFTLSRWCVFVMTVWLSRHQVCSFRSSPHQVPDRRHAHQNVSHPDFVVFVRSHVHVHRKTVVIITNHNPILCTSGWGKCWQTIHTCYTTPSRSRNRRNRRRFTGSTHAQLSFIYRYLVGASVSVTSHIHAWTLPSQ